MTMDIIIASPTFPDLRDLEYEKSSTTFAFVTPAYKESAKRFPPWITFSATEAE